MTPDTHRCLEPTKDGDICNKPAVGRFAFTGEHPTLSIPLCKTHRPTFEPEQSYTIGDPEQ